MNESLPEFWSFSRNRDVSEICSKLITWKGPYSWPGYEEINRCDPTPNLSGVYLLTFEHEDGFLLRSIGITNSIKTRFRQHALEYNRGKYTILDMNSVTKGLRKELWHGWGFAEKNKDLFLKHQEEIRKYTQKELGPYRVFIGESQYQRIRQRLEASLVMFFYQSKAWWADFIDGGMNICSRYNYEMPIEIHNQCDELIIGMPDQIEI